MQKMKTNTTTLYSSNVVDIYVCCSAFEEALFVIATLVRSDAINLSHILTKLGHSRQF